MFKNIQNLVNVVYGSPYLELPKKAVTLNYKIRGILSKLIKNYCTGTKSEQNKNCSSCHTVVRSNLENRDHGHGAKLQIADIQSNLAGTAKRKAMFDLQTKEH